MILKNSYHKKLNFEVNNHPIGIEAYGIKEVEKGDAEILLKNQWIEIANPKTEKEIVDTKIKEAERPICRPCVEAQEKAKIDSKIPILAVNKKPKVIKYKGRNNS